ncbi:MAG: hypothetical protein FWC32_10700 [Firmicutes bacterium]|nr:hypothetical protein [Bacillota bacterium]
MNEKLRVLELLEAGKITADEAAKLLEVLGGSKIMSKETRDNVEEKLQQFAQDVSKFAKDAGCKMQEFYKTAEPKIKKASQTALEKAAAALDGLACSISESIEKAEAGCCDEGCDCGGSDDEPKPN